MCVCVRVCICTFVCAHPFCTLYGVGLYVCVCVFYSRLCLVPNTKSRETFPLVQNRLPLTHSVLMLHPRTTTILMPHLIHGNWTDPDIWWGKVVWLFNGIPVTLEHVQNDFIHFRLGENRSNFFPLARVGLNPHIRCRVSIPLNSFGKQTWLWRLSSTWCYISCSQCRMCSKGCA